MEIRTAFSVDIKFDPRRSRPCAARCCLLHTQTNRRCGPSASRARMIRAPRRRRQGAVRPLRACAEVGNALVCECASDRRRSWRRGSSPPSATALVPLCSGGGLGGQDRFPRGDAPGTPVAKGRGGVTPARGVDPTLHVSVGCAESSGNPLERMKRSQTPAACEVSTAVRTSVV